MIVHIVLFRPRAGLTVEERSELVEAYCRALRDIPAIRRSRFGRRVTHGRPYERSMTEPYEFAALLEFDDVDGLQRYLEHPAHAELAGRFFASLESALMYDYEVEDDGEALRRLALL